jgi:thioredoxin-like negative regulator of GroEL
MKETLMSRTVIKFGAKWCTACVTYQKVWDTVVDELDQDEWDVKEVNIDSEDGTEMALTYGIKSLPTTIIIKDDDIKILRGKVIPHDLKYALGIHA